MNMNMNMKRLSKKELGIAVRGESKLLEMKIKKESGLPCQRTHTYI